MNYIKVKDVAQLKAACIAVESEDQDYVEGFIAGKFGMKSSKIIAWNKNDNEFWIRHLIDDSEETVGEDEIMLCTNIGEAIEKGSFYLEVE